MIATLDPFPTCQVATVQMPTESMIAALASQAPPMAEPQADVTVPVPSVLTLADGACSMLAAMPEATRLSVLQWLQSLMPQVRAPADINSRLQSLTEQLDKLADFASDLDRCDAKSIETRQDVQVSMICPNETEIDEVVTQLRNATELLEGLCHSHEDEVETDVEIELDCDNAWSGLDDYPSVVLSRNVRELREHLSALRDAVSIAQN